MLTHAPKVYFDSIKVEQLFGHEFNIYSRREQIERLSQQNKLLMHKRLTCTRFVGAGWGL